MKKILLLIGIIPSFFYTVFSANSAYAGDLISFDQVRNEFKKNRDQTRISYLFSRCAALQLNVAALLQKGGANDSASTYQKAAEQYMMLAETVEDAVNKKRGVKDADPARNVSITVANIAELYSKQMNSNYAKRGDYIIGDIQLQKEIEDCSKQDKFLEKVLGK